jgi:hypothetical protein
MSHSRHRLHFRYPMLLLRLLLLLLLLLLLHPGSRTRRLLLLHRPAIILHGCSCGQLTAHLECAFIAPI